MRLLSGDARDALLTPLGDAGRSEEVARRLGSAIALGLIEDGEQLPSESQLAATLNVSTVTLRDALADLRQRGLVETRRGRGGGSFVRMSQAALAALSRERLGEIGVSDLRELGDLHAMAAGTAARLAAERASATELARLRDLAARMGDARDATDLHRLEGRYYIEMAAAAQSARLTRLEIEIQGDLAQVMWRLRPDRSAGSVAAERAAVVEAVARHDGDRARALTEAQVAEDTRLLIEDHITMTRSTAS
ncbi:GntR family transcriptional regulator (plasmid) [Georgenia sp. TF02-10]|uniref:FadR/GntR family transcriptional regulator n=1 Tax=Georgenia sp. TF02-10 TaxID=2917725 RepID=UPI001FA76FB8|nr:GntR family transcriptional regulator [Georgenia sp. TF02-10]UNX56634.1 GntR family transcriptional regulator [Georgenia sp. TF02-10]